MNIGKISGISYRSLGASDDARFKYAPTTKKPSFNGEESEPHVDIIVLSEKKKSKLRDNIPEIGIILASVITGGTILYKLFLGR